MLEFIINVGASMDEIKALLGGGDQVFMCREYI